MNRRIVVAALAVLGGVGWYLFRPELLFIDTKVNETLTSSAVAQTDAPTPPATLAAGNFHSVAHETRGTATVLELDGRRVSRVHVTAMPAVTPAEDVDA